MEEEDEIHFILWKVIDDYRYTVGPISLSDNFEDVLPEVASLLNSRIECTVILNGITQGNNKVL